MSTTSSTSNAIKFVLPNGEQMLVCKQAISRSHRFRNFIRNMKMENKEIIPLPRMFTTSVLQMYLKYCGISLEYTLFIGKDENETQVILELARNLRNVDQRALYQYEQEIANQNNSSRNQHQNGDPSRKRRRN